MSDFSVPFRRVISNKRNGLSDLYQQVELISTRTTSIGVNATAADCHQLLLEATRLKEKLTSSLETIKGTAAKWQTAMDTIDEKEKAAPLQVLTEYFADSTTDSRSITAIEADVNDRIHDLSAEISSLTRMMAQIGTTDQMLTARTLMGSTAVPTAPAQSIALVSSQVPLPQLPNLTLPKFDGKEDYKDFWTVFSDIIDKKELGDATKLRYFESSLEGDALELFRHLRKRGSNYSAVIRHFEAEFGKNEHARRILLENWSSLRPKADTFEGQLKAIEEFETLQYQLKEVDVDMDVNPYVSHDILKRFSTASQRVIFKAERDQKKQFSLTEALAELKKHINEELHLRSLCPKKAWKDSKERVESTPVSAVTDRTRKNGKEIPEKTSSTAPQAGKVVGSKQMCHFCSKHPNSTRCYVKSVEKRAILKAQGRCMKCFEHGHTADNCKQPECPICGDKHSFAVCDEFRFNGPYHSTKSYVPYGNRSSDYGNRSAAHGNRSSAPGTVNRWNNGKVTYSKETAPERPITTTTTSDRIRMLTGSAKLMNPANGHERQADVFLDCGAAVTLISETTRSALDLPTIRREKLDLTGYGGRSDGVKEYEIVSVSVTSAKGVLQMEAVVHPEPLTGPLPQARLSRADLQALRKLNTKLAQPVHRTSRITPHLLIGGNDFYAVTGIASSRLPSGLLTVPTALGMMIAGDQQFPSTPTPNSIPVFSLTAEPVIEESETVDQQVKEFFALDSAGQEDQMSTEKKRRLEMEEEIQKYFSENIQFIDGSYHARYAFNERLESLTDGFNQSWIRLKQLYRKIGEKREILLKIHEIFTKQIEAGQMEIVEAGTGSDHVIRYIPTQVVVKESSATSPYRVVIDASSRTKSEPSLNDCLIGPGANLLDHIPKMIIRLRLHHTLMAGDIEKAFLQIKIFEDQRDLLRVLWLKDPLKPPSLDNLQILRYSSAAFGIKQSPYILMATLQHHAKHREAAIDEEYRSIDERLEEENRDPTESEMHELSELNLERKVLNGLVNNCYVDNLFFECDEHTDLKAVFDKAKKVFRDMGMNIRAFFSSNDQFTGSLSVENGDQGPIGRTKILGLAYDTTSDSWIVQCTGDQTTASVTKRIALSRLAAIYDPMGFLIPLLLPVKIFLQKVFAQSYKWDQQLSEEDQIAWKKLQYLMEMKEFEIPRAIILPMRPIHLVLFTDGSHAAMGAVVYLWSDEGPRFLMARNQLAPSKAPKTTPKLELQALLLGMNLLLYAARAIAKEHRRRFRFQVFTDATTLLYWIQSYSRDQSTSKSLGVYVTNRLKKIYETEQQLLELANLGYRSVTLSDLKDAIRYDHVAGSENPADHATRGLSAAEMEDPNHNWWQGPEWLSQPPEKWKREHSNAGWFEGESVLEKAIGTTPMVAISAPDPPTITKQRKAKIDSIQFDTRPLDVMRVEDYSSFAKLQRVTAFVLRFIKMKSPSTSTRFTCFSHPPTKGTPSAGELEEARIILLRQHQSLNTTEVSKLNDFGLEFDTHGLLRVTSGRVNNALIDEESKKPILLFRKENSLPRLMIRDMHEKLFHRGANHVLAEMRRKYWLVKGRQVVRTVLTDCIICKRMYKAPYKYPPAPPLPPERVCDSRPFQHIGLDFLGPIRVASIDVSDHESTKAYVLLITCMSTRLIHLEVTKSLSTIAFLNALERFVARRGTPETITSDNAPTFRMSDKLLRERYEAYRTEERVLQYVASHQIQWNWITAHSPWMGGFYERLVGCVKSAFNSAFGKKTLSLDDLHTQMCRVEAVLNSRPLTHISADLQSSLELPILRPCDFIAPKVKLALPHAMVSKETLNDPDFDPSPSTDVTRKELLKRLNQAEINLEKFWNVFRTFYLSELREHGRLHPLRSGAHCAQAVPFPGEIVLLVDDDVARGNWKLARVLECDGRTVRLMSTAGREISRPVNKVVTLEIVSSDPAAPTNTGDPHPTAPTVRRSKRLAAQRDARWTDSESEDEDPIEIDRDNARRGGRMIREIPTLGIFPRVHPERRRGPWSFNGTFTILGMMMICIASATAQSISCERNAVIFHHNSDVPDYQICGAEECRMVTTSGNADHETTLFSATSTMHGFTVLIKYLVNDTVVVRSHDCPSYDFCDHITCTFCLVALMNPECSITAALATMAVLLYLICLTVYQICFSPVVLSRPLYVIYSMMRRLIIVMIRAFVIVISWPFSRWCGRRKPISRQNYQALLMVLSIIACLPQAVRSCSEVLRFNSESETCTGDSCKDYMHSLLKINPISREACIVLAKEDVFVGQVKLTLVATELYCERKTLGFHRDVLTKYISVKRCPRTGSCREDKCENVTMDSMVPELDKGNAFPGHTFCSESCGGFGCDCFFPSSGCLFYRTFVTPRSEEVYETFECTEWSPIVTVNLTVSIGNETTHDTFRLLPNQRKTILYHKVELTNFATPPFPLLSKKFISSLTTKKVALLSQDPIVRCASADHAAEMKCTAHEECQCVPAERFAKCDCRQSALEENYRIEGILPILTPSLMLQTHNRRVYATISQALSMEVALSLDKKRFRMDRMIVTPFTCSVEASTLTGCYGCQQAARVNFTCSSSIPHGLATIECERDAFSIPCSKQGETSQRSITADQVIVLQRCNVSCGNPVEVHGILKYATFSERIESTEGLRGDANSTFAIDWSGMPDFEHIAAVFASYWIRTVIMLAIVGVVLLITLYCLIPSAPLLLQYVICRRLQTRENLSRKDV